MHRSISSWLNSLVTPLLALFVSGIALGQTSPVLIVGNPSNPFATYYTQILKTEGLNSSEYMSLASVNAAALANRDVVILGETALTAAQVTMFTTWVNGGGNLIAMRPDKQLASLLGLTDQAATLTNGYMKINTAQSPGYGLESATMQYHGIADRYTLNGATAVATLYSNALTVTTSPAVTVRSVGASGGEAAAFTYDLAKSIVYTRQGNPAWAGTERDGIAVIRSDDMFYGPSNIDPQLDWVDRSKIGIPQADEQQRLLTNLIQFMNASRKPLPRFWYFPNGKKAAIVMTGDDHGNAGTIGRFDAFAAASAPGCVVDNWECIRGTSYIYPWTPVSNALANSYNSQGFELAVHITTNCADYTPATLSSFFTSQLGTFASTFPGLPPTVTNRTHCIAFSDWSTQPKVELANGIRMDTNYYYYPGPWVNDTPGFMTGSGMPQRFADLDGTVIDTYQAETQMTDESSQTYPATVNTLLDRALGAQGYYGFFTANIHTDSSTNQTQTWSMDIVNSAKARGVPVITAKQLLTWMDARNESTFTNLAWSGNTLTFTVTPAPNSNGLQVMLPASAPSGTVAFITRSGNAVTYTSQAIKGIAYVVFNAVAGNYTVSYSGAAQGVTVSPTSATIAAGATQNLTATVTGLANTAVTWSMSPSIGTLTPTGNTTATYTAPASLGAQTTVQIVATAVGNTALTAGSAITVNPPAIICPCSIWPSSATPAVPADGDTGSVELGVKFRANQAGYITGLRFYKGAGNGGTHIGNLWTTSGTNLGSLTFTNETTTGWQQMNFQTPIPVNANTTYVASYFAPVGRYSFNSNYFLSAVPNGPLTALADGTDGGNGAYIYNSSSSFPTSTFNSANYWVDVVFTNTLVNQPPTAVNNSYSNGVQNTPLTVAAPGVLGNDTDPEGNALTAIKVTDPSNGSVVLNSNGSFTYTPNPGFTSLDSFSYKANDGTSDSNIVNVNITVTALPTAVNDSYSVAQGQTLNVAAPGVLNNDVNPTQIAITAIKLSDPANGTLTLNTNGSFTYVPNPGFSGTNTFTYKANTTTGDSNTATVTITVNPAPVALGDSYSVSAGSAITIPAPGVLGNDTSPGGLPLTAIKLSDPANGTLVLNTNGSFTYTPNGGFSGTNTFTYKANNGTADSNTATVTISVLAIPVASNDSYSGSTNTPLTVVAPGVLSNDTGTNLTAIKVSDPANGTVTLSANGGFTFNPTTGFSGSTSFTYKVNNGLIDSGNATVTINVTAAPVANNDSYTATSGVALTVTAPGVLSNDTGGTLTAVKLSDPANGTLTLNSNGSFTYTSTAGFTGTNTFTYRANNGTTNSNTATVTIAVNAAPTAVADIYSRASGLPLTIGAPGLLSNDTSPGGIALTAIKVANPANGSVTVNPNGGFTYTPNPNFFGTDSFTYKANNGTADSNTVTVTVCACSVFNSASVPANLSEPGDTSAVELGMKFRSAQAGFITGLRFYKGSGNSGTHIGNLWSSTGTNLATATFQNETATGWQTVNFNTPVAIAANTTYVASYFAPVGRYSYNSSGFASAVVNAPLTALANGTDGSNGLYRYGSTSGFPTSTWNSTNYWVDVIYVTAIGNAAPVAVADSYAAVRNTPLTVAAPGVLGNDTDAEGNTLTAIKVSDPTTGSVTLNTNGSFTYTPANGFTGTDSFTYKANDGNSDSNTVAVTITVNALPTAVNDAYSVNMNVTLNVSAPGMLSNDTSPGGLAMTAIRLTSPANGSVTSNANGSFSYTPNSGFFGTDSFTYKANNATGDSNTATVTITVSPIPTATGDSYSVSAGQPITIPAPGVLGNDSSPGGLPLTAIKLSDPANGTAVMNSNGSFTYTPAGGFSGTNSFTYKATNGTADSNTATVTITVLAIPVANNDSYSGSMNTPLTIAAPGVLSNDTGTSLTAIKVSDPASGAVTLSANGGFTFTPATGFTGTTSFTYKVNNGLIDSGNATVTINVTSAPVASNDAYTATSGVTLTVAAPGLLSNDTGGTLTAIKLTNPANGTATVNSNGSFTYISTAGFTGTNTFTYKANNGSVDSNTATVTITVNAAPTAVADIYSGTSGQALTIAAPGLLSNDTSPGGLALTAIKVANPANGSVTVNPNGGFTYTPTVGFVGTDSFTYKVNNGTADSNTVTVTLCACTIWNSTAVPANLEDGDPDSVELGVKFRSSVAGYIKGIRFYKGTGNTGTHIGNLWSSTGTRLANATFQNETASGWQQVLFTTPVAITANTTYVASYLAPAGHYPYNSNYFSSATVNGPLTALANGTDGSNSVYRYGTTSGFPTSTWNATNYWVDVIFSTVP